MSTAIRLERLTGPALERHIDDLARLRITVFRDFPSTTSATISEATDVRAAA